MTDFDQTPADKRHTEAFRALANGRRRRLLGLLRERSEAASLSDLATHLAAWDHDQPLVAVTDEQHRIYLTRAYHVDLPLLSDVGLVEYDSDRDVATAREHPIFRDEDIRDSLTEDGALSTSLDTVFDALSDRRRRLTLSILAGRDRSTDVRTLARTIVARESDVSVREVPDRDADRVQLELVQSHLPRLADAGLVDYDRGAGELTYEGHPELRSRWVDSSLEDFQFQEHEDGTTADATLESDGAGDVRTIDGREAIVAHGQSLVERADDELFMMFTTTGLLEEECFERIDAALDRGVDVYVGSREPAVRDAIRERVPGVVLWEPQLDWLNLPPTDESVGRLVFADREAVLLGTIESGDDGYEETAIYGTGADNGLVVLVRQLLGARLDHLDAQSEDVLTHFTL